MKKILVITFLFFNSYFVLIAQKIKFVEHGQRSLSIFPRKKLEKDDKFAYLLNGKLTSLTFIQSINTELIDNMLVEKKKLNIDGKEFTGQMYVTTKKEYEPKYLTMKEVKIKYAKKQNLSCIYFIDGRVLEIYEKNMILDESNILEICCHLYFNEEENSEINVIEIFTKTKQNIEKANTILLD